MELSGSYAETRASLRKGVLPTSKKAQWPDDPAERPYENLDLLNLGLKLPTVFTIEAGREFSNEQRGLIIKANLAKNGGEIVSDDEHHDPHSVLDENGRMDFPEVDHIIPKSSGGANAFSNARVVSWELNNRVARVKNIEHLVDVTRLAEPMQHGVDEIIHQLMIRGPKAGMSEADIMAAVQLKMHWASMTELRKQSVTTRLGGLVASGEVLKVTTVNPPLYKAAL